MDGLKIRDCGFGVTNWRSNFDRLYDLCNSEMWSFRSGRLLIQFMVETLLKQRIYAKRATHCDEADEIRDALTMLGIIVEDHEDTVRWWTDYAPIGGELAS